MTKCLFQGIRKYLLKEKKLKNKSRQTTLKHQKTIFSTKEVDFAFI